MTHYKPDGACLLLCVLLLLGPGPRGAGGPGHQSSLHRRLCAVVRSTSITDERMGRERQAVLIDQFQMDFHLIVVGRKQEFSSVNNQPATFGESKQAFRDESPGETIVIKSNGFLPGTWES